MSGIDRDYIQKLYQDPSNPGAFAGKLTFQKDLKSNHNIKISLKELKNILADHSTYLQSALRFRKFPRRNYEIHGYGALYQSDLAQMKTSNGYKYILVVIDAYTLFLMCKALKNKKAETITNEFKEVFSKYGAPTVLETDAGKFVGGKKIKLKQS